MNFDSTRQRAIMAMAAAGVFTALASATTAPAYAAESEPTVTDKENITVEEMGINTYRGDLVVQKAYDELNSDHKYETPMGSNCNYYSNFWGKGCQAWCADFVKYVWKNAEVYDWQQLNSEAGNTARWGRQYGKWHWGTAGIIPGAAVTYNSSGDPFVDSDHVGTFVGWVNGEAKVISGNFSNQVYKHNLYYGTAIAGWTEPV